MSTNMSRDALRDELRSWGKQQRRLAARRDALVQQSLAARISIEEIHQSMGIARTTIDRIGKTAQEAER